MVLNDILTKDLCILKEMFTNSVVPMVITDANLELPGPQFIYFNPAFEKMTGYKLEELDGKSPRILQGEKTDRAMLDKLKATLKKGEFFTGKNINYKKNGDEYHIEWTITPIKDEKGEIKYFFSIQKNITSEILLQEKQEKLLFEQSRYAALGEMIDAIAHQLQTPLGIINLKAQSLQMDIELDELNSEELLKHLNGISSQVMHMSETINEFRGFFNNDAKKQAVKVEKVLNSVLLLSQDELIKNIVTVKIEGEAETLVNVNQNEIKHLILNIINNAKDALVENAIEQKVITCKIKQEGKKVLLKICDNAGGIPQQIIERIFEARFTTKAKDKGSGVGLYLCQQIAKKNNINLTVQNTKEGACFQLCFNC